MTVYDFYPQIADLPFFSNADAKNVHRYITEDKFKIADFSAGELIYPKAADQLLVGIIMSGAAAAYANGNEGKTLLKPIQPGEIFGIANLYTDNADFPSIITARKTSRVMLIDGTAFKLLIENDPSALKCYLKFLNQKILYLNKKITTFTAGSAEAKLSTYIEQNCDNGVFHSEVSMTALARMLGIGRASLYRAFDKLTEIGFIRKDGHDIYVCNANGIADVQI